MTTKIRVFFYSSDFSVCCDLPIVGLSFQFAWETLPPLYSMVLLEKPNIGRVIRGGSHTFECITNYSLCFFTQNYTTHEYTSIQILFVWHLQKKWKKKINDSWTIRLWARPTDCLNSIVFHQKIIVHRTISIACRAVRWSQCIEVHRLFRAEP